MKKILLIATIATVLSGTFVVSTACGGAKAKGPDTLRVNTIELGKDIIGYNGPTPVEISVVSDTIVSIKALTNRESPRYMQMVLESGLLGRLVGKTVEEARSAQLDAVSGATFTSNALIKNIQIGTEELLK